MAVNFLETFFKNNFFYHKLIFPPTKLKIPEHVYNETKYIFSHSDIHKHQEQY